MSASGLESCLLGPRGTHFVRLACAFLLPLSSGSMNPMGRLGGGAGVARVQFWGQVSHFPIDASESALAPGLRLLALVFDVDEPDRPLRWIRRRHQFTHGIRGRRGSGLSSLCMSGGQVLHFP